MKKLTFVFCLLLIGFGLVGTAGASIDIAGYTFNNDAFVDSIINSSGSYTYTGGSLSNTITDIDLATYAFSWSQGAYLQLGFTDNYLFNGSGADLALFELGVPDTFGITIGATTLNYLTSSTGYNAGGYAVNVALINLDDFGLASGYQLSNLIVDMSIVSGSTVPSLAVAGALNSYSANQVPEPATMLLLGFGLMGVAGLRRFKK